MYSNKYTFLTGINTVHIAILHWICIQFQQTTHVESDQVLIFHNLCASLLVHWISEEIWDADHHCKKLTDKQ